MPIVKTALTVKDLPPPPPDKTGWPWTEQSEPLPERMEDGSEWPLISIVTPSYNQGEFIEETIRSVLLQGYPNLEYIIIDGGSTDNSVEIIKKYEQYLAYWVSEQDKGQSNAINKGFYRAKGELIGWQNSDDYYHPKTFKIVAQEMNYNNFDIIYGAVKYVNQSGKFIRDYPVSSFEISKLIPYLNLGNQSMFFRKTILENRIFFKQKLHHALDQEYIVRLALKNYRFKFNPEAIGYYRTHEQSKSSNQYETYLREIMEIYIYIYFKGSQLHLREKALRCMQGNCLECFGKRRLILFRSNVEKMISRVGINSITLEIFFKYWLSFLGKKGIENLKSIMPARSLVSLI